MGKTRNKIKRYLDAKRLKHNSNNFTLEDSSICGVLVRTIKGTVRPKVDQDDSWWFHLSLNHSAIYDIGANIGYTAILALIVDPDKKILLVDPNKNALQRAAFNLLQNQFGSMAQYYTAFVGDSVDDEIDFYTVGVGAAGSMYASHAQSAAAIGSVRRVRTVTLDYLLSFYEWLPDLVKIDVEGAELIVMDGAVELARRSKCKFFVEMHRLPEATMEEAGQFMLDWCRDNSYTAWYPSKSEQLLSTGTIKNRGKCHLLLIPENEPYPEYLLGIGQNHPLPNSI